MERAGKISTTSMHFPVSFSATAFGFLPVVQAVVAFRTCYEEKVPPNKVWDETSFLTLGLGAD